MDESQIEYIQSVLGLSANDLAKAMGVAPITVGRWKNGTNLPTGLQAEVLQGLHSVALTIEQEKDQKSADMIKGLVMLGIGALIFYLLTRNR